MLKRLFDIVISGMALICLGWLFLVLALWIKLGSKGPILYRQTRVGRNNKDFVIYKFRTMFQDSDKDRLITVGQHDCRITGSGRFMRRFKLDELAQLLNVLIGDMSFVGPRPEVRKYVEMYSPEQMHVLDVRPGITSPASIKYKNENEQLGRVSDPEEFYINVIMPDKLKMDLDYVKQMSFLYDMKLIFSTIWNVK